MTAPGPEITWHLDPTVYQRAVYRGHEALIWWTGPGTQLGWCVYEVGGLDQVAQGTGADEADARQLAGAKLRELARQPVDRELFARTAPKWNCVDHPGEGMHYTPGPGSDCGWCGMTAGQIAAERRDRQPGEDTRR